MIDSIALTQLKERVRLEKRRILLPDQHDPRVQTAATILREQELATPIVLQPGPLSDCCEVFSEQDDSEIWMARLIDLHTSGELLKTRSTEEAEEALKDPLLLATTLVRAGYADCGVAGSVASTANVLRACLFGIGPHPESNLVSSTFLMDHPERLMTYADCAVNPRPNSEQLAQIAIDSADTHYKLTGEKPVVALLSFSTKGSAQHEDIDRVTGALEIVKARAPSLTIDGELQADAALVTEIAAKKAPGSAVTGNANVLIFPDLNSGNIAYKLTERLGGATATGPILQGLAKPWIDLSRGCNESDIVNAAVIVSALVNDEPLNA